VTKRRLLLTLKYEACYYAIEANDPSIFDMAKHEAPTAKAYSVLSAQGSGPWPLFTNLNVLQKGMKYRCGTFIRCGVVYDALLIADCGMLGLAEGLNLFEALEAHKLIVVPLEAHPFVVDVKRVLNIV
jgi:hypothetical protein